MRNASEEEIKMTGSSDWNVSADGAWKIRGHSSSLGGTLIIGVENGKIIDRYVAS